MAFTLADGESDGVVYDTRADCVGHQFSPQLMFYVKIPPVGVNAEMTAAMIKFYRAAYDSGRRIIDPDSPDFIVPLRQETYDAQMRAFTVKGTK